MSCSSVDEEKKTKTESLRIAATYYYWKPSQAYFNAIALEQYARTKVHFGHPVLDLGCSDGTFNAMLRERGVLDSVEVALDYSRKDLPLVNKNVVHGAIQGDARVLPFKSGAFTSVFANASISAVRTGFDSAIREVYRVLADRGLFVMAVPTSQFYQSFLILKILRKIGAFGLTTRYVEKLDRRFDHYSGFNEKEWRKKLEAAHFHVEQILYYFTPPQTLWCNILSFQLFRVLGFLQLFRARWVRRLAARFQEKIFRPLFVTAQPLPQADRDNQAGYLLFVAKKVSEGTS